MRIRRPYSKNSKAPCPCGSGKRRRDCCYSLENRFKAKELKDKVFNESPREIRRLPKAKADAHAFIQLTYTFLEKYGSAEANCKFKPGTMVPLTDCLIRPVEELKPGMQFLMDSGVFGKVTKVERLDNVSLNKLKLGSVKYISSHILPLTFTDGPKMVSPDQRLYCIDQSKWIRAIDFKMGESIINERGQRVQLIIKNKMRGLINKRFEHEIYHPSTQDDLDPTILRIPKPSSLDDVEYDFENKTHNVIEDIQLNDKVVTYNLEKDAWESNRVYATTTRKYRGTLVKITAGNDVITCTETHPYFVVSGEDLESRPAPDLPKPEQRMLPGGRWVCACDLRAGDELKTRDSTVILKAIELYEDEVEVYNFGVEKNANYAVGSAGILVHNNSEGEIAEEIAQASRVAKKFKLFECVQCAQAIVKKLGPLNDSNVVRLENVFAATVDGVDMAIGKNGFHVFVDVKGTAFDNLFHGGVHPAPKIMDNFFANTKVNVKVRRFFFIL